MVSSKEIIQHKFENRILAVSASDDLLLGSGKDLIEFKTRKILCTHEKSIRFISRNEKYIGCTSYDGTATILNSVNKEIIDKVEGPETEIKCIDFHKNLTAISTRGKTVWILENFEISKIIDDHTQDVKGCKFEKGRLYSWSYDNTIKMYEVFIEDHSWELYQSIELEDIIWTVVFYEDKMVATLQNGDLVIFSMRSGFWIKEKSLKASVYPIFTACLIENYLAVICNRSCLVLFNKNFEKILELDPLCNDSDILSCSYSKKEQVLYCGGENGILYEIKLEF